MSTYVPKPDREVFEGKAPRSLRDFLVLTVGAGVVIATFYFVLGWMGEKSLLLITPEKEQEIFAQLESYFEEDPPRVYETGQRIVTELLAGRPNYYRVEVSCEEEINAFALPGGALVLTSGLLGHLKTEAGLAFVIGHELGHFLHRDHLKGVGQLVGGLIFTLMMGLGGEDTFGPQIIGPFVEMKFSRTQEDAADQFSLESMQAAYGSLDGATEFFEAILAGEGKWDLIKNNTPSLFSTHPNPRERLARVRDRLEAKSQTRVKSPNLEPIVCSK